MPLTVDDLIVHSSRATTASAFQGLRHVLNRDPERVVGDFLIHLEEACRQGGIDFAFAVAHGANESAWFADEGALRELNFFGIGHPDNARGGITFASGRACARLYVGELLLKLRRPIPPVLADARSYAPEKWDQVEHIVGGSLGPFPIVERIHDLNARFGPNNREAVWMTDPNGPEAIVAKGNALFPMLPDQESTMPMPTEIAFGNVPYPTFQIRDIPNADTTAWSNLGPRTIRGVVWHRMLGSLWGTDDYFRGGGGNRALTDYGIGVEAQDGTGNDGVILRWNDPRGQRSPWANGPVSQPYGDGLAFFNRYGSIGVNRDLVSIEISGFQQTPLSEASRNAIARLTAYWADQHKMPWDTWPMVPGEERSFVLWHREICIGTGKLCPFDVVMNETNALIERTRGVLKQYQTTGPTPSPRPIEYAAPIVPTFLDGDLEQGYPEDHVVDDMTYFAMLRPYEAIKAANRLQGPDTKAPTVGPRLKVRERFRGMYVVTVNGRMFVVTPYASYIDAGAVTPRVSIRKR